MAETFDVVFRGGAVKGVAFVGVLKQLTTVAGHKTRRLVGTSAGAIFATCHAAGYTPDEMEDEIKKPGVFAAFLADPRKVDLKLKFFGREVDLGAAAAGSLDTLISRLPFTADPAQDIGEKIVGLTAVGAACDDTRFRNWMTALLAAKFYPDDKREEAAKKVARMTLRGFHEHINRNPAKPQQVSLVATDMTDKAALVLNERTAPKLPVIEAIRMSMGIPFAWEPVVWPAGVPYFRRPGDPNVAATEKGGNLIVDGGVLSNFPIRYLRDPRHTEKHGVLGPEPAGRPEDAIGLFLDSTKVVPDYPVREDVSFAGSLKAVKYASMLFDTLTDSWDADALRELVPDEDRVICKIGTGGFSWLKFSYPYEAAAGPQLKHLVNSGQCAMREFLTKRKK